MYLTVDGGSVFVATGGRPFDPALPLVVFLHGAGMDQSVWALQTRFFAHHGYGVLAVDLPGHGRSAGPALPSIAALADWVALLIGTASGSHPGAGRAVLVGHSMGSLIALDAAARHPDRVAAIALLGAAARMPVHQMLLDAAQTNDHAAIDMVTLWGFGAHAELGGSRVPGYWMIGAGERLLERAASGVLHIDLQACNDYTAGPEAAAAVRCPALLVLGERDRMTPLKAGRELAGLIAGARTTIIPGSGHMMMIEHPDATLDALRAFVMR